MKWRYGLLLALLVVPAGPAAAADPALTVPKAKLRASLSCDEAVRSATATPLMFVTGTATGGKEALDLVRPGLDDLGLPTCTVEFPNVTTGDMQTAAEYLVHGIRTEARRAGRPIAMFGISQGGVLMRLALDYWPSLRKKVIDAIAVAAPHHGSTTIETLSGNDCAAARPCAPALWQMRAGSNLLAALNRRPDESPGPTEWTTVRSTSDEIVQPQKGRSATSRLTGASNVLIQSVCPGRATDHLSTLFDPVTWAAAADAISHRGGARPSRFASSVCDTKYAPPFDEGTVDIVVSSAVAVGKDRLNNHVSRVPKEPRVKKTFRAAR